MLLRKRGNGSVLLPSLPPSRPPARTLGGGHRLIAVSSGHRPLRRVGPRSALDSTLVIDTSTLARDNSTTSRPTQERYREEATGTCPKHHATIRPSIILIRTPSIIVLALTLSTSRWQNKAKLQRRCGPPRRWASLSTANHLILVLVLSEQHTVRYSPHFAEK